MSVNCVAPDQLYNLFNTVQLTLATDTLFLLCVTTILTWYCLLAMLNSLCAEPDYWQISSSIVMTVLWDGEGC